eukprot:g4206.t1
MMLKRCMVALAFVSAVSFSAVLDSVESSPASQAGAAPVQIKIICGKYKDRSQSAIVKVDMLKTTLRGYGLCEEFCSSSESRILEEIDANHGKEEMAEMKAYSGACVLESGDRRREFQLKGAEAEPTDSSLDTEVEKTLGESLPKLNLEFSHLTADMHIADREGHSVSRYGDSLLLYGGCKLWGECYDSLLHLDMESMKWSKIDSLPGTNAPGALRGHTANVVLLPDEAHRADATAPRIAPTLFVIGGASGSMSTEGDHGENIYSPSVWMLPIDKLDASREGLQRSHYKPKWIELTAEKNMVGDGIKVGDKAKEGWCGRQGHTSVLYEDSLLIYGGFDSAGLLPDVLLSMSILPAKTYLVNGTRMHTWHILASANAQSKNGLYGHAASLIDGHILAVFGGFDGHFHHASRKIRYTNLRAASKEFKVAEVPEMEGPLAREYPMSCPILGGAGMLIGWGCSHKLAEDLSEKVCYSDVWTLLYSRETATWSWREAALKDDDATVAPVGRERGALVHITKDVEVGGGIQQQGKGERFLVIGGHDVGQTFHDVVLGEIPDLKSSSSEDDLPSNRIKGEDLESGDAANSRACASGCNRHGKCINASVRDRAVGTVSAVMESVDVIRDGVDLIAQPEPVCFHAQEAVKMESARASRCACKKGFMGIDCTEKQSWTVDRNVPVSITSPKGIMAVAKGSEAIVAEVSTFGLRKSVLLDPAFSHVAVVAGVTVATLFHDNKLIAIPPPESEDYVRGDLKDAVAAGFEKIHMVDCGIARQFQPGDFLILPDKFGENGHPEVRTVKEIELSDECNPLNRLSTRCPRGCSGHGECGDAGECLYQDVLFSMVESAVVMAFANMGAAFVDQATRSTMIAGLQMAVLAVEQIILCALGRAFAKLLGTGQRLILAFALRVDSELHVNVGRTVAAQAAASMGIATPILESASVIRDGKAGIAMRSKSALEL